MSRIGKLPIPVPSGVDIAIDGQLVTVKGPKGTLSHTVAEPITVAQDSGVLTVVRPDDERESKSLHGLSRTLIANMVTGVTVGYIKTLEIVGTGYRVVAAIRCTLPLRRASRSESKPRSGSLSKELTSSRSARSRPTFVSSVNPTRTRVRACGTRAK
jgi:ribosomal protein L6P/L9E